MEALDPLMATAGRGEAFDVEGRGADVVARLVVVLGTEERGAGNLAKTDVDVGEELSGERDVRLLVFV